MTIKQSVINTFNRVGIDYKSFENRQEEKVEVRNWLTGVPCLVSPLVAECIEWVYRTQLAYEKGDRSCPVSDFDRVRYFILEVDSNAYSICID